MTNQFTVNLLRGLYVIFMGLIGSLIGAELGHRDLGLIVGLLVATFIVSIDLLLRGLTLRVFSAATFGLLLGLFITHLVKASDVFVNVEPDLRWALTLGLYCIFGYLGTMLALRSNQEDFSLIIPYVRFTREGIQDQPVLIDTNIIIDGRIPELCRSGFLSSQIIVPRFVVDELQSLADSHDTYTRDRGRRGIRNLERMENETLLSVSIHDSQQDPNLPIDVRLLHLARVTGARLFTNDSDLAKTARLQQVRVLNINELTHALRSEIYPGDRLTISLIKPGRDEHQAVGYAEDGTMIIVNHAAERIGEEVEVTVAGTTQTQAGKLVFAEPDGRDPGMSSHAPIAQAAGTDQNLPFTEDAKDKSKSSGSARARKDTKDSAASSSAARRKSA